MYIFTLRMGFCLDDVIDYGWPGSLDDRNLD